MATVHPYARLRVVCDLCGCYADVVDVVLLQHSMQISLRARCHGETDVATFDDTSSVRRQLAEERLHAFIQAYPEPQQLTKGA